MPDGSPGSYSAFAVHACHEDMSGRCKDPPVIGKFVVLARVGRTEAASFAHPEIKVLACICTALYTFKNKIWLSAIPQLPG